MNGTCTSTIFGSPPPGAMGTGQKFNLLNMVMWHIKLKGMSNRPGYTKKNLAYSQTGDLGMGSKGQIPLDFFESVGICDGTPLNVFQFAFEIDLDPDQTRQNISSDLHLSWLLEMFWKLLIERKKGSKLPSIQIFESIQLD